MINVKKLKSSELDSAIYAMILGDGCVQVGKGINCTFKIGHSIKQKEYLLWKNEIVKQIGTVTTRLWGYEKQNAYYLETNARKYFTKLERIFYSNRTKVVSKKILDKLTDLSLAIWHMDDGYISYNTSGTPYGELCVDQFPLEKVELIQQWFQKKFKMNVGIRQLRYLSGKYAGKVAYRITFNKENCKKLSEIIKPYVNQVNCMKYKIVQ
jgi:hypothetical protein